KKPSLTRRSRRSLLLRRLLRSSDGSPGRADYDAVHRMGRTAPAGRAVRAARSARRRYLISADGRRHLAGSATRIMALARTRALPLPEQARDACAARGTLHCPGRDWLVLPLADSSVVTRKG